MSGGQMKTDKHNKIRCKAKSKRTGKQCQRFVVDGYKVCYHHGAGAGPPKENKNALKHGAYVNKLLDEEEKKIFDEYFQKLNDDFILNSSSDQMSAELACIYFVKLHRIIKDGNSPEGIYKMDLLVRNQLKDLKATKDKREGDTINLKTSPADWVADFMEKAKKAEERAAKRKKNSHICGKSSGSK